MVLAINDASLYSICSDLKLAHALADTAASIAVAYFRQPGLDTSCKADGSPVTQADLLVEAAIRKQLSRDRSADGFAGEESGSTGQGRRRWYVDPIDGTTDFINGGHHWRTLVALQNAESVVIGLASFPMLHRRWWATVGGGAWTSTLDHPQWTELSKTSSLAVTGTRRLSQATVAMWPPTANLPQPLQAAATRLAGRSSPPVDQPSRSSAGLPGALLVAAGQLDAFFFAGAGAWDLAAMIPIVEEAGGKFTDLSGGRSLGSPAAIFSNGLLHNQILRCLNSDH